VCVYILTNPSLSKYKICCQIYIALASRSDILNVHAVTAVVSDSFITESELNLIEVSASDIFSDNILCRLWYLSRLDAVLLPTAVH